MMEPENLLLDHFIVSQASEAETDRAACARTCSADARAWSDGVVIQERLAARFLG